MAFSLISVLFLVFPQTPPKAQRRFEVVSIKPNNSGPLRPNAQGQLTSPFQLRPGGLFTATNVTLLEVLTFFAPKNQMEGGPEWVDSARFDINARADQSAGEVKPYTEGGQEDWKLMIQGLLEDRFKLKMHRETKEISALALVRGKDAPKVQQYTTGPRGTVEQGRQLRFHGVPVSSLTGTLSSILRTRVIDATNMRGIYDFVLDPYEFALPNGPNPTRYEDLIVTAVEQQLGFRLETRKAPIEMLIIDHAEKPSENRL